MPDKSNSIHPAAILEGHISLGSNNTIGPGVVITGPAIIGSGNYIGPGVKIGSTSRERLEPSHRLAPPRPNSEAFVVIGNGVLVFDQAVIHKPMFRETRIGDRVEVGAFTMVAHDCIIGENAVLSPHVALGAYVSVGSYATLGLGAAVHNRLAIGGYAMCGLGSAVVGHVPPTGLVVGNPARLRDVNRVGILRAGMTQEHVAHARTVLSSREVPQAPWLRQLYLDYEKASAKWPNTKGEVKWTSPE